MTGWIYFKFIWHLCCPNWWKHYFISWYNISILPLSVILCAHNLLFAYFIICNMV